MELFELIKQYINTNKNLVRSVNELDKAIKHIVQLLSDSYVLYSNNGFSSSVFLSITACEEIAKAHIGIFTDGKTSNGKEKNMFRDHKTKHILAAMPTVPMGDRLEKAIGKTELERMMNMAKNSGFVQLRERSLYFQRENDILVVPSDKIDKNLARLLLLFAIEVFDDALVGTTKFSMEIYKKTDTIFEELTKV
ncbi:AbiV family abortive infection protein [Aliarcobacter cryaerophilus]|uniref:AbiV family abortive infection protein n=1 Tax=Aliarcobacter cryaerophilus TaxID=28198 RepID=UPI0021B62A9D|nr:AbiV family abortive infection protein [Aliarcobacter cryaerophilus]MCT7489406.1 AbiV family abortive infection protein [Aliarcobacter cryaerophilus]